MTSGLGQRETLLEVPSSTVPSRGPRATLGAGGDRPPYPRLARTLALQPGALWLAGLLVAGCLAALAARGADPEVQVGFPKWGDSPRLVEYTWCQLPFEVDNPTDQEQELLLTFRPVEREDTVFTKTLRVGPRAVSHDRLVLTGTRTKEYLATLTYPNGQFIHKQQVMSDFQNGFGKKAFYFVNDNPDVEGVSAISKNDGLHAQVILTRSRSENLPTERAGYGGASAVAIVDVNFAQMVPVQFEALDNFVASGGTLLFLGPETTLAARLTPLDRLLPVRPLRVRRIDALPELEQWAGTAQGPNTAALAWPQGTAFLESLPADDARVTLAAGQFPVICWKRYGLGVVGVCALSPFSEALRAHPSNDALWNHLLAWTTQHPLSTHALYSETMNQATLRLIGFKVPSAVVIRNILGAYLLLIVCLFLFGTATRRQVLAWVAGIVCALVLTAVIFFAAYHQMGRRSDRTLTLVSLLCDTPAGRVAESVANVFSKTDDRPAAKGIAPRVWFRAPPPAPGPVPAPGQGATLMSVHRQNSLSTVPHLDVHALKNARFVVVEEETRALPPPELPQLEYGPEGPRLARFALPEGVPSDTRAYVVYAGGTQRLRVRDRACMADASAGPQVELDTVAQFIEQFLGRSSMPAPTLALVYRRESNDLPFTLGDGGYAATRHSIHLMPVREVFPAGDIRILAQQVTLSPASKSARALQWNGEWQEAYLYDKSNSFHFYAALPPDAADIEPSSIEARVTLLNPGGTVAARLELVPLGAASGGEAQLDTLPAVAPTEGDAGRFVFTDLASRGLIDRRTGRLLVRLTVSATHPEEAAPAAEDMRINRWRVSDLRLSVQGRLPEATSPRKF